MKSYIEKKTAKELANGFGIKRLPRLNREIVHASAWGKDSYILGKDNNGFYVSKIQA